MLLPAIVSSILQYKSILLLCMLQRAILLKSRLLLFIISTTMISNTYLFFAGLTQSISHVTVEHIVPFLFEIQSPDKINSVLSSSDRTLTGHIVDPFSSYSVGYVLAVTHCKWRVHMLIYDLCHLWYCSLFLSWVWGWWWSVWSWTNKQLCVQFKISKWLSLYAETTSKLFGKCSWVNVFASRVLVCRSKCYVM